MQNKFVDKLSKLNRFPKILLALLALPLLAASCSTSTSNQSNVKGVIKTLDGGQTWIVSNVIASSTSNISGLDVSDMAFDASNNQTIYLSSTDSGLWKTTDAAQTWKQILSKVTVYDFYVVPQNNNDIYAVGIYDSHGKIIESQDGGVSWQELYNESSQLNSVNTIVADPNNPQIVLAALNDGTLLKSIDGGLSWLVQYNFNNQTLKLRYDSAHNLYMLLKNDGIYESTDNGQTWSSISKPLTDMAVYNESTLRVDTVSSFVKFALDPNIPGVIYTTTSKGLYKTTDNGKNWAFLSLPVNSSGQLPRAIATDNGGMVAYTSIGGTIYRSIDGGQSWQTQETPTTYAINKILIDPQKSTTMYAGIIQTK
jgi:photosystem II stability/assembly factor-like uncharacterized protein